MVKTKPKSLRQRISHAAVTAIDKHRKTDSSYWGHTDLLFCKKHGKKYKITPSKIHRLRNDDKPVFQLDLIQALEQIFDDPIILINPIFSDLYPKTKNKDGIEAASSLINSKVIDALEDSDLRSIPSQLVNRLKNEDEYFFHRPRNSYIAINYNYKERAYHLNQNQEPADSIHIAFMRASRSMLRLEFNLPNKHLQEFIKKGTLIKGGSKSRLKGDIITPSRKLQKGFPYKIIGSVKEFNKCVDELVSISKVVLQAHQRSRQDKDLGSTL